MCIARPRDGRMFELCDSALPESDDLEIGIEVDAYVITVPFAECSETGRIVSIECCLRPQEGYPAPDYPFMEFYELSFVISVTNDWGSLPVTDFMDRMTALPFIPEDGRHLVIPIVALCYSALVNQIRPDYVYRTVLYANLPMAALHKHNVLTSALQGCGFSIVSSGTDLYGRSYWLMTRYS